MWLSTWNRYSMYRVLSLVRVCMLLSLCTEHGECFSSITIVSSFLKGCHYQMPFLSFHDSLLRHFLTKDKFIRLIAIDILLPNTVIADAHYFRYVCLTIYTAHRKSCNSNLLCSYNVVNIFSSIFMNLK